MIQPDKSVGAVVQLGDIEAFDTDPPLYTSQLPLIAIAKLARDSILASLATQMSFVLRILHRASWGSGGLDSEPVYRSFLRVRGKWGSR